MDRTAEFVNWFMDTIPIEPVWLCPLRLPANPQRRRRPQPGRCTRFHPEKTYVNVGFWSAVPTTPGAPDGATNRLIEQKVTDLGGHKSLYSDAYYTPEHFAELYGGVTYAVLKTRYDPDSRLLNLYDKAVRRQ